MAVIEFHHLTKDYGNNKGVFDVSFEVNKGETFGYLGPNGAGKTTSIRHLLGFLKPDSGEVLVDGKETFANHYLTNPRIGYLPGEIAFPDNMTGTQVMDWCRELKKIKDSTKQNELIDYFEFKNFNIKVRKMSKGMKQKLGIVCAFMGDPEILVLDEPTTGLDPLMQHKFIAYLQEEKKKGKTILLSSHIFAEIERTCDRVAILRNGRIAELLNVNGILHSALKEYNVVLKEKMPLESTDCLSLTSDDNIHYHISFSKEFTEEFLKLLSSLPVLEMEEYHNSIEESFMKLYQNKEGK